MQEAQSGTAPGTMVAPEPVRVAVSALARAQGVPKAAEALAISQQTLGKLAGGLPVRRATISHVELKLAELASAQGEKAA
jgi:hypothetical protein